MEIFGGQAKSEDVKAVLESLTATIESINQRVAAGGGGSGEDLGPQFRKISTWLQFLTEQMKAVHQANNELKGSLVAFKAEVNKTITDNLQASMDDLRRIMQQLEIAGSSPKGQPAAKEGFTPNQLLGIGKRLEQIILLDTETVELLRKQNQFLQTRLGAVETKLDMLLRKK